MLRKSIAKLFPSQRLRYTFSDHRRWSVSYKVYMKNKRVLTLFRYYSIAANVSILRKKKYMYIYIYIFIYIYTLSNFEKKIT